MMAGKVSRTTFASNRKAPSSLLRRESLILDESWRTAAQRKHEMSRMCEFW